MSEYTVEELTAPEPALFDQIEPMFLDMYDHMTRNGLLLRLAPGGEKLWRAWVESTLGRLTTLAIARAPDGRVVGFALAAIALMPDYLGGGRVGRCHEAYVAPEARGQRVNSRMMQVLRSWFLAKGASSVEAQVLVGNASAIAVWERIGFRIERFQLRRFIDRRAHT